MAGKVFVLERAMVKSPAFRTLTGTAIIVLLDFALKRQVKKRTLGNGNTYHETTNNGEITYYFSEALKRGIPRPTFNRARDSLLDRGFIDIEHSGTGGKKGDATLYSWSERWRHYGTDKFERHTREKDSRRGIGFQKYWAEKNIGNDTVTPTSNASVTPKRGKGGFECQS